MSLMRLLFRYLSLVSLVRAIFGGPDKLLKRQIRKAGYRQVRRIR